VLKEAISLREDINFKVMHVRNGVNGSYFTVNIYHNSVAKFAASCNI